MREYPAPRAKRLMPHQAASKAPTAGRAGFSIRSIVSMSDMYVTHADAPVRCSIPSGPRPWRVGQDGCTASGSRRGHLRTLVGRSSVEPAISTGGFQPSGRSAGGRDHLFVKTPRPVPFHARCGRYVKIRLLPLLSCVLIPQNFQRGFFRGCVCHAGGRPKPRAGRVDTLRRCARRYMPPICGTVIVGFVGEDDFVVGMYSEKAVGGRFSGGAAVGEIAE